MQARSRLLAHDGRVDSGRRESRRSSARRGSWRRPHPLVVILGFAAALAGCTSLAEVQPGPGEKAIFRGYSYDQLWTAAYRVMNEHFEIREMDKARGVIRAERTFHYMQGRGNWVGIFITPPQPAAPEYQVEVVNIGKSRIEIMGQAWEGKVLRHLRFALDNPSKPIP